LAAAVKWPRSDTSLTPNDLVDPLHGGSNVVDQRNLGKLMRVLVQEDYPGMGWNLVEGDIPDISCSAQPNLTIVAGDDRFSVDCPRTIPPP
jgi:hypothetical protein